MLDAWLFTLEEDVLAADPPPRTTRAPSTGRSATCSNSGSPRSARTTPAFAPALRGYRAALSARRDRATADGLAAWLGGQPHVAAAAKRAAGVRGDLDHFGALASCRAC